MPITPADLRGMLRADAVGLVLGLLLMLTALATLVLGSVLRRRAVSLLWLGAFALLYGSRLLERAAIVRLSFDVSTDVWERIDAAMTYAVPIPIVLFARAIFPAWRRFWTTGAIGLAVFAVYGVVSDATLNQPHSAITANNVIAIAFFVGVIGWMFRPGLTPSRELHTLRIGALIVSVAAVADNLRGMKVLRIPWSRPGAVRVCGPYRVSRNSRDLARGRRLAATGRDQPGAGHRTANPVFDPAAGYATHARIDHRVTVPPDDCRRR